MLPVPSIRSNPRIASSSLAHDYRLMVEAVQAGDLETAQQAYGRMMERLGSLGAGADDALARIGASLRQEDLAAANRTLEALEGRALRVLRGLRELNDMLPRVPPGSMPRKLN
jgi:hypothetical protein